ncbi:MAG: ArsR family transcriptional regulator [Planctomycetota bacterium]|nr:MAG: ArsR family transcriptional regulator [Planctomycetota bacterium]
MLRAMGDPERLRLMTLLEPGEVCVSAIAAYFNEQLSTVSQRLKVLRNEDLVLTRRSGKHLYYRLADGHVRHILANALSHAAEVLPSPASKPLPVPLPTESSP